MNKLLNILSFGVVLFVFACSGKSHSESVSPRINHVMLYVSDLERSIAFYTQALGIKVTNRLSSLTIQADDASSTNVDIKLAFLKFDDQDFVLEISERAPLSDSLALPATYQHIGIDVLDIDLAYRKALEAGADPLRPVNLVSGNNVSAKTAFVKGPDGELIEFMQILSGEF